MIRVHGVSASTFFGFLALDFLLIGLYVAYHKQMISRRRAVQAAYTIAALWVAVWLWCGWVREWAYAAPFEAQPLPRNPRAPAVPTFLTATAPYAHAYPGLTIVTGASANHFVALYYLLHALVALRARCIVYDLGLTPAQAEEVRTHWGVVADYRRFAFEQYPPWFDMRVNAGEYAWKPTIISEVLDETRADVCWLDAGTHVTTLQPLLRKLRDDPLSGQRWGAYVGYSAGRLREWTHPAMYAHFGEDVDAAVAFYGPKRCVAAGLVAFRYGGEAMERVVRPWAACARVHACIAPPGSDRSNHRQDQSAFTYLLYKHDVPIVGDFENGDGFRTHCDVLWNTPRRCWPDGLFL